MDKKFLDKVVNQLVYETMIDYSMGEIQFPFSSLSFDFSLSLPPSPLHIGSLFTNHCRDIYGLNREETMYVWEEYKQIIKDKIDNNGL